MRYFFEFKTKDRGEAKMKKLLGALGVACIVAGALLVRPSEAQEWSDEYYTYDATKLTGSWNMTTTLDLSTCTGEAIGTKSSRKWEITFGDGAVKIKSSSGLELVGNEPYRYSKTEKYTMDITPVLKPKAGVYQLKMMDKGGKSFKGRMIEGGECVSLSNVTLTKL